MYATADSKNILDNKDEIQNSDLPLLQTKSCFNMSKVQVFLKQYKREKLQGNKQFLHFLNFCKI